MKMRSTLKVPGSIIKCVLAIIYSNSFSHCKGDQKKTVAISQMFSYVQLHAHGMHLSNNRICRYTYSINTTLLWPRQVMAPHTAVMDTFCWGSGGTSLWKWEHNNNTRNQDRYVNELVPPRNGLYWVQSGVLPKKFGHKLFLSLSAQLDNVWKSWKK